MRNPCLDGLKFFLIFLVVFAHIPYEGSGTIYKIIYSFHMPLFIGISGYCSSVKDNKSILKSISKLFKVFLIFTIIDAFITYREEGTLDYEYWITPNLWYLECLLIYRLLLNILARKVNLLSWKTIAASFVIGFAVGFVPIDILAFQRLFTFFPFFLIGYCYKNNRQMFSKIDRVDKKWVWGITLLAGIAMAVVSPSPYIPKYHYTGWNAIVGCPYKYLCAIMMSLSVLKLLFTKLEKLNGGGCFTLQIYVLHGLVLRLFYVIGNYCNVPLTWYVTLMYTCITILLIIVFSKTRVAKFLF